MLIEVLCLTILIFATYKFPSIILMFHQLDVGWLYVSYSRFSDGFVFIRFIKEQYSFSKAGFGLLIILSLFSFYIQFVIS